MKQNLLHAFVGAAFLALSMPMQAEGVKWLAKCLDVSKVSIEANKTPVTPSIDGTTLKIAGTAANEIKLTLTPGEAMAMNNGQTFVVVEANTTFDKTKKLDHLTVGDAQIVNKTGVLVGFTKTVNGHILNVFSILDKRGTKDSDVEALNKSINYLFNNESFSPTEASFYLQPKTALADDAAIEIYNIGFYTLGDILTEYTELAGSNGWRFTKSQLCEVESFTGSGTNTVKVNNKNEQTTLAYNYLRARTLQGMPDSYTKLDYRNMNLAEDETAALRKDAFAGLSFSTILLQADQYKLFPTENQKVAFVNSTYTAYKDGVAPSEIKATVDGNKSTKAYSFTRNFKAGNNSCVLPFDVNAEDLINIGLTAYTFDAYASGNANFKTATSVISAGTPMLIKAEEAGLYLISAAETPNLLDAISGYKDATDASGNKFVGSFEEEVPSGYSNCYGLDKTASSFMKMGDQVKATYYRAFLSLADQTQAANAVTFSLDGNSGTTGISNVQTAKKEDGAYYNLQGVKMNPNNLPHGIYIHNGKKIAK